MGTHKVKSFELGVFGSEKDYSSDRRSLIKITSYNSKYSILRKLCLRNIRISQSRQSIDYLGPALLNSMPFEIKEVENPSTFKNTVEILLSRCQNIA